MPGSPESCPFTLSWAASSLQRLFRWRQNKQSGTHISVTCSVVKSCLTLCDSTDYNDQALPCMGFPRQEYWSGLPFPSPEDLHDPGIKPWSPALAGRFFFFLTTEPPEKPHISVARGVKSPLSSKPMILLSLPRTHAALARKPNDA